jgi:hypothetical protein
MANYEVYSFDTGERDTLALTLASMCNRVNLMPNTITLRDIDVDYIRDRERCQGRVIHDYDPNFYGSFQDGYHAHAVDSVIVTTNP